MHRGCRFEVGEKGLGTMPKMLYGAILLPKSTRLNENTRARAYIYVHNDAPPLRHILHAGYRPPAFTPLPQNGL